MKQLFFRNMEKGGALSTNFFEVMHNCYYGDVIPSLPGGIRWLEKAVSQNIMQDFPSVDLDI